MEIVEDNNKPLKTYILTASLDEGVMDILRFEAEGIPELLQQFFPKNDSEKFYAFTQKLEIDTGSYYNRTPITLVKVVEALVTSHVDGDSLYGFQVFEFVNGLHQGKDITYTLRTHISDV